MVNFDHKKSTLILYLKRIDHRIVFLKRKNKQTKQHKIDHLNTITLIYIHFLGYIIMIFNTIFLHCMHTNMIDCSLCIIHRICIQSFNE